MVREKSIKLPLRIFFYLMPIVMLGTAFSYVFGEWVIVIVVGEKYRNAVTVFRWLLPLLVLSFPSMLFGWPCLGAIDKQKSVTFSTITTAIVQVILLVILIITHNFTLIAIAIARIISEAVLLTIRVCFCIKYKTEFAERKCIDDGTNI